MRINTLAAKAVPRRNFEVLTKWIETACIDQLWLIVLHEPKNLAGICIKVLWLVAVSTGTIALLICGVVLFSLEFFARIFFVPLIKGPSET